MKGHWVGIVDARIANRLEAQVARLEAEHERDTQALQSVWDDFHIVEQKRDEARAANAALAAALREWVEDEEARPGYMGGPKHGAKHLDIIRRLERSHAALDALEVK